MENLFTIIGQNRKGLYHFLKNTPKKELFKIPNGFNNNIWWNIAHVVVTEQKLIYGLSGLPLNISQDLVTKYQKGTSPKENPNNEEFELIKRLMFSLPEKTEKDYKDGLFSSFKPYMTTPKVPLNNVDDAITFNTFHEGLHLGSILALARAVKN